jgi:hypothetical protein
LLEEVEDLLVSVDGFGLPFLPYGFEATVFDPADLDSASDILCGVGLDINRLPIVLGDEVLEPSGRSSVPSRTTVLDINLS